MAKRPQFEVGQAATLEHYPAQDGVPTAATVTVYTGGTSSTLIAETAATLDSYSESVAGVAQHDRVITVTAAPVSGRRYWLADSDGLGTEVVCRGGTSTRFVLETPATRAITSGTIKGRRMSVALTTTHTATPRRDLRVRWEYTIAGVVHVYQHYADIVYMPWDLAVSEETLERLVTSFGEQVGDYRAWTKQASQAVEDVRHSLIGENVTPDLVRAREILEVAAAWRTLQLRFMRQPALAEAAGAEYAAALSRFFKSREWYDSDDDLEKSLGRYTTRYLADGTAITVTDPHGPASGGAGEVMGAPIRRLKIG